MRSSNESPNMLLSAVATFPKNYFLENLAVRSDNSVLVQRTPFVERRCQLMDVAARGRSRRIESIRPGSTATAVCYRRTLRRRCQAARLWPGAIPIAEVSPYATIRCDLISRLAVDASACWWSFSCGTGSPVSLASMHIRGHVGSHLSEWSCAGRTQPPRMHPLHNCNTMLPTGLLTLTARPSSGRCSVTNTGQFRAASTFSAKRCASFRRSFKTGVNGARHSKRMPLRC